MSIEEEKKVQLGILDEIARYCDENGLKYFLAAGTLIGAVRHKGFIPWDDDIDIDMPREDYNKFMKSYPNTGRYKTVSLYNDKDYYLPYGKVVDSRTLLKEEVSIGKSIGVYVDIFPIDNLTDNYKDGVNLCQKNQKLQTLLNFKTIKYSSKRTIWKNIILLLGKTLLYPLKYKWIVSKMDENSQLYINNKSSKYVGSISYGNNPEKVVINRYLIEDIIDLDFEGKKYHCPKEYHKLLTNYYGDYMTPPPENKRYSTHVNEAYWL